MAYPFEAAEVLTAVDLNAMIGAPTQNAQTGTTYTAVLLDAGKTVTLSNAAAVTLTIPAQASVSWADNTQLNFLNLGAGTVTITAGAGVTINGTPLTLATSKGGSLVRTASNTWTFIPFSAGVDNANFTNAATGTYTSDGIDYKYITFTGSGSLVVDQAGFADILVIGGGGGGGNSQSNKGGGGGGAGAYVYATQAYFAAVTQTVTIGAGGRGSLAVNGIRNGATGQSTACGTYIAPGGGAGGGIQGVAAYSDFFSGGSGGGAGAGTAAINGGTGLTNFGNNGGANVTNASASGGGAGGSNAVGGVGVSSGTAANGGAGTANSITNLSVTRAAGGSGGSFNSTANTIVGGANTGNGGGGAGGNISTDGVAGGSGVVIIRVVV